MDKKIAIFLFFASTLTLNQNVYAQCTERWPNSGVFVTADDQNCLNALEYNLGFLTFTTDARSAGQGLVGIALSPDVNSIRYNTAKLAHADSSIGLGISFANGISRFTRDKRQLYFSAYHKINTQSTLALSWQSFSYGKINVIDSSSAFPKQVPFYTSNALTLGYAQKIGKNLSAGINLKFIHRGTGPPITQKLGTKAILSGAIDLSLFYDRSIGKNNLSVGLTLSNLGPKVNGHGDQLDFIPSNFGLGASWLQQIGQKKSFRLSAEINKLLIPSPERDIFNPGTTPGTDAFKEQSAFSAFFRSWSDAPNGLQEELYEVNYRIGTEVYVNHEFIIRAGFYNDHPYKGGRQVITVGLGLRPSNWSFDISYNIRARRFRIGVNDDLLHLSAQYYIGRRKKSQ